jgi:phage shock protein PspC (stress-responsive transcriptional regulator)
MKKVININFQGRVIPIEETAYDILQQYIDSLRKYFANEEGRDEIVNDIESRIAELFSERLKKGATCITDDDVNAVISSIGRPSDFEQADAENVSGLGAGTSSRPTETTAPNYNYARGRGRLYRNADDKIIGGVCSGLANYLGIDPVIMRILFVVFVGALFWVYIVLWIIVPSQSAQSNITKRLYRSSDDKVIGGVCGGLAAYFNISTWIPRLIFALPLILSIISGPFNYWWGDFDIWAGPKIVTGSLSFTLFVTYIILWISVPVAVTAAEKLEMRGERVDLNSIRDTVKEDLESLKTRAQGWGNEVKQSAQNLGQRAKTYGDAAGTQARAFASEAAPVARSAGSSIGQVIGILFKAFFLFIAGLIALTLFGLLMALLFGGFLVFPFKDFVLEGFWQNLLAWSALIFFMGVPIVALITWLVRRIVGVRSRNHYLGYVFGSLWVIGLISFILLVGSYSRNFRADGKKETGFAITQPPTGKLYVDVAESTVHYYDGSDFFEAGWNKDWPIYGENEDTLMMDNVRIEVARSRDSLYHVHKITYSQGPNSRVANDLADRVRFDLSQHDSTLVLPRGFGISQQDKFRNQRIKIVIEVPVGKRIQFDHGVDHFDWYTININRRKNWRIEYDDNWDYAHGWSTNIEYIMTREGLERTDKSDKDDDNVKDAPVDSFKANIESNGVKVKIEGKVKDNDKNYRYQQPKSNQGAPAKDTTQAQQDELSKTEESRGTVSPEMVTPLYVISRFAR